MIESETATATTQVHFVVAAEPNDVIKNTNLNSADELTLNVLNAPDACSLLKALGAA